MEEKNSLTGKKTPLYDQHVTHNGKIVPFAGYLLPVQYEGVIAEHMAVRSACGMFDVSHMGEFLFEGSDALNNLNQLLTNDFSGMYDGQARYSPICNDHGGIVDDLIVYRVKEDCYFAVVNAANRQKDFDWLKSHLSGDCTLTDISDSVGQIAIQGPKAKAVMAKLFAEDQLPSKYYSANFGASLDGMKCVLSRTGYTGEMGYEIYLGAEDAEKMWKRLMEAGQEYGIAPCGLGARDTLRLEAAMPLYGHELGEDITPLEAGLDPFVKLEKEDFIGKDALVSGQNPQKVRVGLKVTGRGIVREDCTLYSGQTPVGVSTSGTHAPFLGYAIAMALVDREYAQVGTALSADVRGRRVETEVVAMPFYKRPKKA